MKTSFLAGCLIAVISMNTAVAQQRDQARQPEAQKPNAEARRKALENRRKARQKSKERDVARLLKAFDENDDGLLVLEELPQALHDYLAPLDSDKDGKLSQAELLKMRGRPSQKVGEIITGAAKGERYDDTLEVGDAAPDFTLADPAGKRDVTLSDFKGKRPVVLIFGSYT